MSDLTMSKQKEMVEVYQASGEAEARIIQGLLENYGIPSFLKSNAAPSVHVLTVNGMGEVKVMVWGSMAEKARELVKGEGHA